MKYEICPKCNKEAIDLFAGIGGIRLGFEQAFGKDISIIYSNEIDQDCCKTYEKNFNEQPKRDIRDINIDDLPDFDILLAGFPCQAFSIAGKRKGFEDNRGNLFFYLTKILEVKKPIAIFLENVSNLIFHDKGRTFSIIRQILEDKLKYFVHYTILNAKNFGLAQNRERIYIVGFKENLKFKFPNGTKNTKNPVCIKDILINDKVDLKYYLSQQYLNTLKEHRIRHESKGHGFGYQIISPKGIANTLVCGGMGKERNLVRDEIFYEPWKPGEDPFVKKNNEGIRKMTEREWARLQGFPDTFEFPVSMTQAYKQIANSVPIPVIRAIALEIKNALNNEIILRLNHLYQKKIVDYFFVGILLFSIIRYLLLIIFI